jgi:hypothetical protein
MGFNQLENAENNSNPSLPSNSDNYNTAVCEQESKTQIVTKNKSVTSSEMQRTNFRE